VRAAAAGFSKNSGGIVVLIIRYLVLMWRYRVVR